MTVRQETERLIPRPCAAADGLTRQARQRARRAADGAAQAKGAETAA